MHSPSPSPSPFATPSAAPSDPTSFLLSSPFHLISSITTSVQYLCTHAQNDFFPYIGYFFLLSLVFLMGILVGGAAVCCFVIRKKGERKGGNNNNNNKNNDIHSNENDIKTANNHFILQKSRSLSSLSLSPSLSLPLSLPHHPPSSSSASLEWLNSLTTLLYPLVTYHVDHHMNVKSLLENMINTKLQTILSPRFSSSSSSLLSSYVSLSSPLTLISLTLPTTPPLLLSPLTHSPLNYHDNTTGGHYQTTLSWRCDMSLSGRVTVKVMGIVEIPIEFTLENLLINLCIGAEIQREQKGEGMVINMWGEEREREQNAKGKGQEEGKKSEGESGSRKRTSKRNHKNHYGYDDQEDDDNDDDDVDDDGDDNDFDGPLSFSLSTLIGHSSSSSSSSSFQLDLFSSHRIKRFLRHLIHSLFRQFVLRPNQWWMVYDGKNQRVQIKYN